jgi:hypothetical protein
MEMQPILSADIWTSSLNLTVGGKRCSNEPLEWRDALPTSVVDPPGAAEHPPLIRAIDRVRQYSRQLGTITPWLGLPFSLRDQGLSHVPLPCLCGGARLCG